MQKPFEQGKLDGLCAVYSIINATKIISNTTDKQCEELFKKIILFLAKNYDLPSLIVDGIYSPILTKILIEVKDLIPNRAMPFRKRKNLSLDIFWNEMIQFLSYPKRAILIGMEGRHDHWTLATSITDRQINLFDSNTLKRLYRSKCTIGEPTSKKINKLTPTLTYFLA